MIIVLGRWSAADIEHQVHHVATMGLHNSGSNCIAAQVVILNSEWEQKDEFLAAQRPILAAAPHWPAWYPGCDTRVQGRAWLPYRCRGDRWHQPALRRLQQLPREP
ncbi:MAG TPA: hypothetical protein VIP77_16455 [Jiangellaceae bacterium]